ncbi:MAG: hypothetical protein HZA51_04860 [Planctomycetes bacterium]|nr:hypothetical protein [Planctomycetota bacterium]
MVFDLVRLNSPLRVIQVQIELLHIIWGDEASRGHGGKKATISPSFVPINFSAISGHPCEAAVPNKILGNQRMLHQTLVAGVARVYRVYP